jgi:ankyrin repeat protein
MALFTPQNNLALRANQGKLTVEEVNNATKLTLEQDTIIGGSVLEMASMHGSNEVVKAIIGRGMDVNHVSQLYGSVLIAATRRERWDNVLTLLENGANPQTVDGEANRNALHYAALFGAPAAIVKALVDGGVDVNAVDVRGNTPAKLAHQHKHVDTAFLIEQLSEPIKSANFIV